jgi:hypothetical protein
VVALSLLSNLFSSGIDGFDQVLFFNDKRLILGKPSDTTHKDG